jgi:hypothetical protein
MITRVRRNTKRNLLISEFCTVPECKNKALYIAPGDWCQDHWDMWWDWPENKPEPEWMTMEWNVKQTAAQTKKEPLLKDKHINLIAMLFFVAAAIGSIIVWMK